MRIRIVANKPIDNNCSNISNLIGNEFDVISNLHNGAVSVNIDDDELTIFNGEYEIIEK